MEQDVNAQIQAILARRGEVCGSVQALQQQWAERQRRAQLIKHEIGELQRLCLRAQSSAGKGASPFTALERVLSDLDGQQMTKKMMAGVSYATAQLDKLSQRFNRKTVNIAVAGVGRCGKSTALKSIIGGDQSDNAVIPSGNGPAVTAGKSTLCSVLTKAEERTVVQYHTEKSFLDDLVNPLLVSISLAEYQCDGIEDFASLDFSFLRETLDSKARFAQDSISGAELAVHQADEGDKADSRVRFEQAKAYAASFSINYERLEHLHDIWKNLPYFRLSLIGGTETVPLNQTYRYVSYPKAGQGPAICYAVKETFIHCVFPGNGIQSLQLIDLPGLGTSSQSEKKCFLDGFNYSVDLALMLRRPEGLFQNFATKDDLEVIDVLSSTFGEEHLQECMVLFQNDASLPQADVESAFQKVAAWNRTRHYPITMIRGDARNEAFMQGELLPKVLTFMLENLPVMDRALLDSVMPQLSRLEREFDDAVRAFEKALSEQRRSFPSNTGANAIADRAEKVRAVIMNGLSALLRDYALNEPHDDSAATAVEAYAGALRKWAQEKYNPKDAACQEEVQNALRTSLSAIPFANAEIHAVRIRITETFAALENIHTQMIRQMQGSVATVLHEAMPALMPEKGALADFMEMIHESRECPQIYAAVAELNRLEIPFYNVVYPDLRKQVFDNMEEIERNFLLKSEDSLERRTQVVLSELQNVAIHWIWKAENLLNTQNRIMEIICAALERFEDGMVRNAEVKRELISLVEARWGVIQNDGNSWLSDVRGRIDKILKKEVK